MSRPKMPAVRYPDPPPPAPERSDSETSALAEQQRQSFFRRGGRAATFLGATGASQPTFSAIRFLGAGA